MITQPQTFNSWTEVYTTLKLLTFFLACFCCCTKLQQDSLHFQNVSNTVIFPELHPYIVLVCNTPSIIFVISTLSLMLITLCCHHEMFLLVSWLAVQAAKQNCVGSGTASRCRMSSHNQNNSACVVHHHHHHHTQQPWHMA